MEIYWYMFVLQHKKPYACVLLICGKFIPGSRLMNDKCVGVVYLKFWGVIEHARAYIHMVLLSLLHLGTQNAIVYQTSGSCMMYHKIIYYKINCSTTFSLEFSLAGRVKRLLFAFYPHRSAIESMHR